MSFLTDLFHGDFKNLGHDLTAHWKEDLPLELAAITAPFAAFGLPEFLGGAGFGAGGLFGGAGGLFGGGADALSGLVAGEAGSGDVGLGLAGGADAFTGGTDALALAAPDAFAAAPGVQAINASLAAPLSGADALTGPGITAESATQAAQGSGGFLDKLISGAEGSLMKNPLGIAASGLGLGLSVMRGNQGGPNADALSAQASKLGAQGEQLMSYLQGGTLPPGMKAQLDQATAAAKARIISNHASNGMSTDPSQNSALAQELASVDTNAVAAMAQTQINLMQTGLSETGLSSQLYTLLSNMDRADNTALMNAISNFAASLGGGPKSVSLKLA